MGAEATVGFIEKRNGATAESAYREACEQARYEFGNVGYTGSIAESRGFFLARSNATLRWEAARFGHHLIDTDKVQKWGATAFIPVANATAARELTVEVDVLSAGEDYGKREALIAAAVRAKCKPGEQVEKLTWNQGRNEFKVVTKAGTGPSVTRYAVEGRGLREPHYFAERTEALAWAKALLEKDNWYTDLSIKKVTIRESGEPLVTVKRVPTKQTLKVTATVGKPGATVVGWATAGVYSS